MRVWIINRMYDGDWSPWSRVQRTTDVRCERGVIATDIRYTTSWCRSSLLAGAVFLDDAGMSSRVRSSVILVRGIHTEVALPVVLAEIPVRCVAVDVDVVSVGGRGRSGAQWRWCWNVY